MTEVSRNSLPWSRFGAEAVIIVASILLALGVDEWREENNARELEREYLVRLLDDLDANEEMVAAQRFDDRGKIAHARAVYPYVNSGEFGDLDGTTTIVASYQASPSATPSWVDDTFEELKSTGRLSLIRNADLRHDLIAYHRFLEERDWAYQLRSTDYRDAVRAKLDPDIQLQIRQECRSREVGCRVSINEDYASAYLAWLGNNEELAGGLRRVITQWTRGEQEFLPKVEERTAALKALIEAELGR
jgi:hypothetical protein